MGGPITSTVITTSTIASTLISTLIDIAPGGEAVTIVICRCFCDDRDEVIVSCRCFCDDRGVVIVLCRDVIEICRCFIGICKQHCDQSSRCDVMDLQIIISCCGMRIAVSQINRW